MWPVQPSLTASVSCFYQLAFLVQLATKSQMVQRHNCWMLIDVQINVYLLGIDVVLLRPIQP